jgi:hypothetical protein
MYVKQTQFSYYMYLQEQSQGQNPTPQLKGDLWAGMEHSDLLREIPIKIINY